MEGVGVEKEVEGVAMEKEVEVEKEVVGLVDPVGLVDLEAQVVQANLVHPMPY